ncbi:hypothetical protein DAEQUDRAFT_696103 [Daedalea quercina L-15889]|uniref:Uncharacterized protein n=1 Tax=Daedalea quercina L-15889 TaxID=1314783 RepID=A0A165MUH3_9APHY|nr:hypothetical protein DAEQUDRAFT_696103 [Daedalea quercina L-15889]
MFFYLSFLRPPPSKALLSTAISITPQVANDLRTELYDEPQDIYYAWYIPSGPLVKPNQLPVITKPQKLTTWRHSNAYKELLVPVPSGIKEGQSCYLALTAHAQGYPHIINLGSADVGQCPFPVMSVPILFSSNFPKRKAAVPTNKQENVERIYRIPLTATDQVFMRVKEQTSFDLDKKVWDSGIGLSSWITTLASDESVNTPEIVTRLRSALLSADRRNVVELGAGTGMVSLTLGALRSTKPTQQGCIITTDLPSALPLLEHNISSNASLFRSDATRPKGLILDWDEQSLPVEVSRVQEGFDVVMYVYRMSCHTRLTTLVSCSMADVTYNTSAFPSLIRTVSEILHLRSSALLSEPRLRETMILLGYKERDPAERTLWEMMRDICVHLEKVDERRGAGGDPVEIWIGTIH